MYLQGAGMRGALLRSAIRCKPVKVKKYYDYFELEYL